MAMVFYILRTPQPYPSSVGFFPEVLIEEFQSGIWTERYTQASDMTLVLPATRERVAQLVEGTFIGLEGSKEVMIIETQVIEDNILTVTGRSLETILERRAFVKGYSKSTSDTTPSQDATVYELTPGQVIRTIVDAMLRNTPTNFHLASVSPTYGSKNLIQNLILGTIADGNSSQAVKVSVAEQANAYNEVLGLADAHNLGISLYLNSASLTTYSLVFTVYEGVDRTKSQTINQLLRFSPELDSLSNVKELRSSKEYLNTVRVYPEKPLLDVGAFIASVSPPSVRVGENDGWGRRESAIVGTSITYDTVKRTAGTIDATTGRLTQTGLTLVAESLKQEGLKFLKEHARSRVIDGEIVPHEHYMFKTDYNLGDIVEVENYTGGIQKARITEYIRSQDQTGQREYPTLAATTIADTD